MLRTSQFLLPISSSPSTVGRNHNEMVTFTLFSDKARLLHACLCRKISSFSKSFVHFCESSYRFFVFHSNPFLAQLAYFVSVSLAGFLALKLLRSRHELNRPNNIDFFFTSVSACTVSSMATVEMEVFSEAQLWVLIVLMLVGGEVFTSMLGLQFMKARLKMKGSIVTRVESVGTCSESQNENPIEPGDQLELGVLKPMNTSEHTRPAVAWSDVVHWTESDRANLNHDSIGYLRLIVLVYLALIISTGSVFISSYLSLVPGGRDVLKSKGLRIPTFSIFTAVSSFGNCGFTPTNENMMVFQKNSILLLLIIPQVLAGNTLFPPCLRFIVWVLGKLTQKEEFEYILRNPRGAGYKHLLPPLHCACLAVTVFSFVLVQILLFCSLEWNSAALEGMTSYQKIVAALFISVNTRSAGETIVDMSTLSPACLVLFVVMMYLPPYTLFLPKETDDWPSVDEKKGKGRKLLDYLILSQLSYLVIFTILICISERNSCYSNPLNFSVLNIVFEVISAYGNVGYSLGYSCHRLLNRDSNCKDAWYGFVGRWSNKGKLILILVMFFGRLKNFSMGGGRAWKLS